MDDRKNRPASYLRQLDYVPGWLAAALGVGAGMLSSILLLNLIPVPVVAGLVFLALLVGACVLAFSGRPITVVERRAEPKPGDEAKPQSAPPETAPAPAPLPPELRAEMVRIPARVFRMGSPDDEEGRYDVEGPVHEVSISAFECMRYLVPRRLYKEVMAKDPGWPEGEADERPVN